ncbi:MAG TPA: hypothetical protein DCO93_00770 [Clostridiales bacterium]|nr:hypothetical protein [Clostridiales bacterium]
MYCPMNNSDSDNCMCTTRCCRLYNTALAFLGAVMFFVLGIIFALVESDLVADALPLLIVTLVLIFIVFIVTILTRGCCNNSSRD